MPNRGTQSKFTCSIHKALSDSIRLLRVQVKTSSSKSVETAARDIQRGASVFQRAATQASAPAPSKMTMSQSRIIESVRQYLENNTTAMNKTVPAAIPAAYQRTRPVSVRLSPR